MRYPQDKTHYFYLMIRRVCGQAFSAANYILEENPMQQARGLVRFHKQLVNLGVDSYGFIEWQLVAFEQSPFARFRIQLLRNQGIDARAVTDYDKREERNLAWVIWHHYRARVLPDDDFWWSYRHDAELPHLLASAGKLLFGYGVPYLEMWEDFASAAQVDSSSEP